MNGGGGGMGEPAKEDNPTYTGLCVINNGPSRGRLTRPKPNSSDPEIKPPTCLAITLDIFKLERKTFVLAVSYGSPASENQTGSQMHTLLIANKKFYHGASMINTCWTLGLVSSYKKNSPLPPWPSPPLPRPLQKNLNDDVDAFLLEHLVARYFTQICTILSIG